MHVGFIPLPNAESCGKISGQRPPKRHQIPFWSTFRHPQRNLSTSCGFVDILGAPPGRRRRPFPKNTRQGKKYAAYAFPAGRNPPKKKRIYQKLASLHRACGCFGCCSTICPKAKMQVFQGLAWVFHSFHSPYCYCCIYHISTSTILILGGHASGKEALRSFPFVRTQRLIGGTPLCSLP